MPVARRTSRLGGLPGRRDANRSPADLLREITALTRELTEAREQQTATSQVLKVISSSPTNIQPVLDIIGERDWRASREIVRGRD
jgi:hypothetical protein